MEPSKQPAAPAVSQQDNPRFRNHDHRRSQASAFTHQGDDYDQVRPGYPDELVHLIAAQAPRGGAAVDLGAGTGKLAIALAARGLHVTAVDTSAAMLERLAHHRDGNAHAHARTSTVDPDSPHQPEKNADLARSAPISIMVAPAEHTGLPDHNFHLVTAAQAWHWFDVERASKEAARLMSPGGTLALLWNTLDVTIPWVHRLSRIMHAGDVQREGFTPQVGEQFTLHERRTEHWQQNLTTTDVGLLARTRSYLARAEPHEQDRVLRNLDWYLHEHLGHEPGAPIGIPYRSDLFLYRLR